MNIEVRLPDGSVASFPQGTPNETMQAEIERYLASVEAPSPQRESATQAPNAPVEAPASGGARPNQAPPEVEQFLAWPQSQSPAAAPERRMPMNAMEAAAQRRGPPQRNADVHIRQPDKPRSLQDLSNERLLAEYYAVESGGMGEFSTDVGEGITGGVRNVGEGLQRRLGKGLSTLGLTGAGSFFLEGASKTRELSDARAEDEKKRDAARAERLKEIDAELKSRGINTSAAADAADTQAGKDAQSAAAAPAAKPPVKPQPLRLPKGMSIQEAMESGRGPEAIDLSMGDGSSVRLGKVPPKAMKNGVQSGMDFLIERSDAIVLELLRAGHITAAKQFRDFVQSERTQKGMRETNRSYIALHYGDESLWAKSLKGMVDNLYPEGELEIDTKGTRFVRDGDNGIIGGIVSIRNRETGEIFEQEYIGMESLMRGVSEVGMPDAAYKYQKKRVERARTKKVEDAESYQEAFDSAFKEMFDSDSFVDYEKNAISQEELASRIEMVKQRIRAVRPDLVPEQSASPPPAGAASGVGAVTGGSNNQVVPTFQ